MNVFIGFIQLYYKLFKDDCRINVIKKRSLARVNVAR